ncbi:MAG: bifunctional 4-hydroxy-2-oxoglutarate aldolase/2-dehydro-3-deoxy-phosphogluconate aldolase [Bacilli bacterium]|nr:bifunctional 4-hydroxy-2-oxoglutarate aldolase/2-dehydro-3-deoxy-phosphogluconate aldolase [Bacilli bacterium]
MIQEILETKLVPVVVFKEIEDVDVILPALSKGGVNVAEICFRNEASINGLKLAIQKYPDMVIGAGTIINKEQAELAISYGAKFIVSPGLSESVNEVCVKHNIPYIPGVVTPTEIIKAIDLGIYYLKFFPAGVFGGLKAIKALSSAFPSVKFMPTGGVDNSNLAEFIKEKSIFAIGGSWLVKGDITANCLEANKIIKGE